MHRPLPQRADSLHSWLKFSSARGPAAKQAGALLPPHGNQTLQSTEAFSLGAAATRLLCVAAQDAARFRRNPREHSFACLTRVDSAGAGGNACAMRGERGLLVPSAVAAAAFRRHGRPASVQRRLRIVTR